MDLLVSQVSESRPGAPIGLSPLVNLFPVELPTLGITLSREALELRDLMFDIFVSGQVLKMFANLLVQSFANNAELLPGTGDDLFVDGECDPHEPKVGETTIRVQSMV